MLHKLRLRFGMLWPKPYPTLSVWATRHRDLLLIMLVAFLWAYQSNAQYQEELADVRAQKDLHVKQLLECLSGRLLLIGEDGEEVKCYRAETNKPKQ